MMASDTDAFSRRQTARVHFGRDASAVIMRGSIR